jgi:hypothetical protein
MTPESALSLCEWQVQSLPRGHWDNINVSVMTLMCSVIALLTHFLKIPNSEKIKHRTILICHYCKPMLLLTHSLLIWGRAAPGLRAPGQGRWELLCHELQRFRVRSQVSTQLARHVLVPLSIGTHSLESQVRIQNLWDPWRPTPEQGSQGLGLATSTCWQLGSPQVACPHSRGSTTWGYRSPEPPLSQWVK